MMSIFYYTLIVFLATVLGAITGAGGGSIIKPVFDLLGTDSVTTISVYSSIAVFAMCLSSIYRHRKSGLRFDWKTLLGLSFGSLAGGMIGEAIFKMATQTISNQKITSIQSLLLFGVLLLVLLFTQFQDKLPKYNLTNTLFIIGAGMVVGALSVFLGIGGGPLNVIVLIGLMSLNSKTATPYSIAMIFFAQIPKILKIILAKPAIAYNPYLIPFIVVAAVLGGNIGTRINHRLSEKQVGLMYNLMMSGLLLICLWNILHNVS